MKTAKFFYRVLLPALILLTILRAHPLNTSNIDLDLNKKPPTLSLRFYIFNLTTPLMLKSDPGSKVVYSKKDEILEYIQNSITVKNGSERCKLEPTGFMVEKDIALRTNFTVACNKPIEQLSVKFTLFFEFDKTQEGVLQLLNGQDEQLFVFSPHQKVFRYQVSEPKTSAFSDFVNFIKEGVWHIWEGIDHILFLLMLLVPSVLVNRGFKSTLLDVLKIVTAFTLSHSLTLSLSMFNILNPPQQIIETLIALSVLFTALNNIYPLLSYKKEWLLAFGFGFIHGFGFANAMHEMNLQNTNFFSAVFGFNIGVELGQIVIVLVILPLIYILSVRAFYGKIVVPLLSFVVANIALLWAVDRAFSLRFMPF